MFRTLDSQTSVYGQLAPADVAAARAQGFALIVNNRPDDEQPGQPAGAEIADAAAAAGMAYVAIPVDHSGLSDAQVAAMVTALEQATGPTLAFCRSGTRSTYLWALARARMGEEPEALIGKAANAGYDLAPLRPLLAAEAAGR